VKNKVRPLEAEILARRMGRFRNPLLTLMHIHVAFVSLAFALAGALLSGSWHWDRFVAGSISLLVGKQGLYFLDELSGRQWGTNLGDRSLWGLGMGFLSLGLLVSLYLILQVPIFTLFVATIGILGLLYNLRIGRFHTRWNFGLTWASLPFLGGYILMGGPLRWSLAAAAVAVGIFATLVRIFSDMIKVKTIQQTVMEARLGMKLVIATSFIATLSIGLWRLGI
jgi:hypothetical protein